VSTDDDEAARLKLIANERAKLTATYANGLAVAVFAVGGFAPFISATLADHPHFAPVVLLMAVCWITSGAIHWGARTSLRDLRP
jgi:hypothetical protein